MPVTDFKVVESVGKGSFASVYKVKRKSDNKLYALKRVKIGQMSKREVDDALSEIRFLASIRHRNIVGFLEAYTEDNGNELHIVMEYCGNGDLSQKIERYKRQRKYIDEKVLWKYLIQCLRALEYLHAKDICHRDLKAANSFIGEDGGVKIGDMNVSKKLNKGNLKTQIGTPYYMSPEIWEQRPYDSSCDIWSLGCMIYELCCLRPPFVANDLPRLKRAIISGRYPMIPARYSKDLSNAISAMLKVNPANRISASALLRSPALESRLHYDEIELVTDRSHHDPHMLKTIVAPRHMRNLSHALPKPCYPDTRPNSPGAWTVEEQITRRREEVAAEKGKIENRRMLIPDTVEEHQESPSRSSCCKLNRHHPDDTRADRFESNEMEKRNRRPDGGRGSNDPLQAGGGDNRKVWFQENTRDEKSRKKTDLENREKTEGNLHEQPPNVYGHRQQQQRHKDRGDRVSSVSSEHEEREKQNQYILQYRKKKAAQDYKHLRRDRTPAEERELIRARQHRGHRVFLPAL